VTNNEKIVVESICHVVTVEEERDEIKNVEIDIAEDDVPLIASRIPLRAAINGIKDIDKIIIDRNDVVKKKASKKGKIKGSRIKVNNT
jgi:hypothetical protein